MSARTKMLRNSDRVRRKIRMKDHDHSKLRMQERHFTCKHRRHTWPLLRRHRRSVGTPKEEEAVAAEWWSGDAGFGAA